MYCLGTTAPKNISTYMQLTNHFELNPGHPRIGIMEIYSAAVDVGVIYGGSHN